MKEYSYNDPVQFCCINCAIYFKVVFKECTMNIPKDKIRQEGSPVTVISSCPACLNTVLSFVVCYFHYHPEDDNYSDHWTPSTLEDNALLLDGGIFHPIPECLTTVDPEEMIRAQLNDAMYKALDKAIYSGMAGRWWA